MSETPTNVTPPPDLTYGYVDGRIILAIGDRSDAGRMPDPVPADGMTVTLTPANTILKVASPTPATVIKQPIVCNVDANGYLIDGQGARGVWLVTGTYKVTYSHSRAIIPTHDIEVTTGHTEIAPLDLTTAMPPGGPVLAPSEYAELNGRLTILEAGGGGGGGAVDSVNGEVGVVVLDATDVGAAPAAHTTSADHDDRYVVVVEHGATAGTARPSGATVVLWVGSVEPTNAIAGDQWDNASGSPSVYIEEPASEGTTGQVLTTDGAGGRTWTTVSGGGTVVAADVDSEASTDGHVLTSDGAGGAAWEAPAGGGSDPWTYAVATVDTPNNTATAVNITGLSVPALADGLYVIEALIVGTSASTSNGTQIGVNAGTGATVVAARALGSNGAAAIAIYYPGATNTLLSASINASSATLAYVAGEYDILLRASSMSGTVDFTVRSESGGGGSVAKADSFVRYRRIGS